jgi:hypothetical protein
LESAATKGSTKPAALDDMHFKAFNIFQKGVPFAEKT